MCSAKSTVAAAEEEEVDALREDLGRRMREEAREGEANESRGGRDDSDHRQGKASC